MNTCDVMTLEPLIYWRQRSTGSQRTFFLFVNRADVWVRIINYPCAGS